MAPTLTDKSLGCCWAHFHKGRLQLQSASALLSVPFKITQVPAKRHYKPSVSVTGVRLEASG